jgi:hypothetical protein
VGAAPAHAGQRQAVHRLRSSAPYAHGVCAIASKLADPHPPFILPAPLTVPPLAQRSGELDRIIAEYAGDAIAELAAPSASFTADDHAWVRQHAAASLAEVEKATARLVAIRTSRNMSAAAAQLGMSLVSLTRWLYRRRLPPGILSERGSHR